MFERLFRAVMPASVAALPAVALAAPMGITILFALNAVVAVGVLATRGRGAAAGGPARPPWWLVAAGFAIPALGLASALWSLIPDESALRACKIALIMASGMAVAAACSTAAAPALRHVAIALLAGLGVATLLALTDQVGLMEWREELDPSFAPRRGIYNRGATVILLLAWLAVLMLQRLGRPGWAVAVYIAAGLLMMLKLGSGASMVVWVLSGAVYLAWRLVRGARPAAFGLAIAGACIAAPLLVMILPPPPAAALEGRHLPSSWSHRIVIWQFAAARIADRPLLGWGLDASRRIPGGREMLPWRMDEDANNPGGWMSQVQRLPLHPHSLALQVWLELGAPGAIALALLLYLLIARGAAGAGTVEAQAAVAALVFAGMLISNISYGAWQSWWLSTLWLTGTLAIVAVPRSSGAR